MGFLFSSVGFVSSPLFQTSVNYLAFQKGIDVACLHTFANVAKVVNPQFLQFECSSEIRILLSNDAPVN